MDNGLQMENFETIPPDDASVTLVAMPAAVRAEVNGGLRCRGGQSEAATSRTNVLQRTATKAVLLVTPLMVISTGWLPAGTPIGICMFT